MQAANPVQREILGRRSPVRQGASEHVVLSDRPTVSGPQRLALGVMRRLKYALPAEPRLRRVPFGVTRGLRIQSNLRGPAYFPLGVYEYEIQHWIRRLAAPDGVVYDIGAASGVHALAFAKLTGRSVVAFERDPLALESMRVHLLANPRYGKKVTPEATFVSDVGANEAATTLDDYVRDHPVPTMLKIDVEGAELEILTGGRRLLEGHRPHLLIETHSPALEREIGQMLIALRYRPVVIPQRRRLREDRPAAHNRWLAAVGSPPTR